MKKIKGKGKLALYACSGLGINMLNIILGSYLCSALLVGGFDAHIEQWTYLNRDLVIAGLWGTLIIIAKAIDGLIDLPMSHFIENLKTKFGRRRPGILIGYIPTIIAYLLFLVPIDKSATILNTIWFAFILCVFYGAYTLTMLTYYATFSEIVEDESDILFISNVKSVCDVVYFSLSYALVPLFVSLGVNIRFVALIFLPLALTMLIPIFMLKEESTVGKKTEQKKVTLIQSLVFTFKDKSYILWLGILFIMNMGLQLFLGGINEYFSTANINMTFVMASCFAPVPFTILLYNKLVRKYGLGFGYRYILIMFSIGMGLMGIYRIIPENLLLFYAIACSIIVSFSIGAFFSVTYTIPSNRAARRSSESANAPSMYYAIQGLFEAVSAGLATGGILVFLKAFNGGVLVPYMTVIAATLCMIACALSFILPKEFTSIGKAEQK